MLNNATCFKEIHIVCGRSDLRSGIDRLAAIVKAKCGNEAFKPDIIYLFCGRRPDRIKVFSLGGRRLPASKSNSFLKVSLFGREMRRM